MATVLVDEDGAPIPVRTKRTRAAQAQSEQERLAEIGRRVESGALMVNDPPAPEEEDGSPVDDVLSMLQSLDGDGTISIYRHGPKGRVYCGKLTVEQFNDGGFDLIRDSWGGGEFEIAVYGRNANNGGRNSILTKKRVQIAENRVALPGAAPATNGGELAQIVAVLQSGQQQQMEVLKQLVERPAADPIAGMRDTLNLMTLMREAMGLNAPQVAQKTPIGEMLEAMRELRGAAKEFGPDGEEKSDASQMMELAQSVMQTVSTAMQRQPNPASPGAPIPAIQVPPNLAITAPPAAHATINPEDDPMANPLALQAFRMLLMKRIAKGVTPEGVPIPEVVEQVANDIYDMAPVAMLSALATAPDWWEQLTSAMPELLPHRVFVDEVHTELLAIMASDADDEEAPEQATAQPGAKT